MFLVVALIVLTFLVGVFLGQHVYYVCINQTTNERHKTEVLSNQSASLSQSHCKNNHEGNSKNKSKDGKVSNKHDQANRNKRNIITKQYRPFDRGLINNVFEVFLPFQFISKMKLKVK